MPSQLAVLHMNASPAAPRLCLPPLLAALEAAQASAALAQEQLQHLYGMPHLDLSSDDTMLQLLSAWRLLVAGSGWMQMDGGLAAWPMPCMLPVLFCLLCELLGSPLARSLCHATVPPHHRSCALSLPHRFAQDGASGAPQARQAQCAAGASAAPAAALPAAPAPGAPGAVLHGPGAVG